MYESRKLEKAFIEALNFDETDDNLDHVLSFRTGREIDLFNKIQSNYFQSNVATIPKIIEAYNNSNSSGNRMRNDKELDNILSTEPFTSICTMKLEAGIVEFHINDEEIKSKKTETKQDNETINENTKNKSENKKIDSKLPLKLQI